MLSVTTTATEAIEGVLSSSDAPDTAGLRIEATKADEDTGAAEFQLALATEAQPGDQVLADGDLFLEQVTSELLAESELDAEVSEGQVNFKLGPKAGDETEGAAGQEG